MLPLKSSFCFKIIFGRQVSFSPQNRLLISFLTSEIDFNPKINFLHQNSLWLEKLIFNFRINLAYFWLCFQPQRLINEVENLNFRSKICAFWRFEGYFQLQRLINDPENQDFRSNICSFWRFLCVFFDNFGGRKSRFLDFFKVLLEFFREGLGIILRLKTPTIGCIFSSIGW